MNTLNINNVLSVTLPILLKNKIDEKIKNQELFFGWKSDIIDYNFLSYIDKNNVYECKCEYIENNKTMIKYVDILKESLN